MRILVAGCGNIFLGDDGFGSVVARRLTSAAVPEGVSVTDFGIGGIHLAYELTGGYDATILVDAVPRGGSPGTLHVIEPEPGDRSTAFVDAHDMTPQAVLALAGVLDDRTAGDGGTGDGGTGDGGAGGPASPAGRVLLVGCEPADTSPGMELSPLVAAAVEPAARLVLELISERLAPHITQSVTTREERAEPC
jgi:hydrogenase maturation protease